MAWSIPIGRFYGTTVRLHVTFLLFLVWIGAAYFMQAGARAAIDGVVLILAVFACIVLHEFGHVLVARRYGVRTPDITLLPIGGVARMTHIPEQPTQELAIALAGPAVNLVIATILFGVTHTVPHLSDVDFQDPGTGLIPRLSSINLFLAVFNLIPAFPMDGGRVLRALLTYRAGYARATQLAAAVGQGIAFLFGFLGLMGNPLLLFIALFVYMGAAAEAHGALFRQLAHGMIVSDVMTTHLETLSPDSRMDEAALRMIHAPQQEFPVVDGQGVLRGLLTHATILKAMQDGKADSMAADIMVPDIACLHLYRTVDEALRLLEDNQVPAIGVTDARGRFIGLVSRTNIGEVMTLHILRNRPAPPLPLPP
ncbi:site-2 protease family protein [Gluconacetobacter takamatsuzukensis]|uniref:Zinc metalloprotease n=1 Tax=Gluconacetobacter takamatsuzukensis TaxID=1286190 RepID=A0A7W4KFY9_9PROT|nr:site-2 protease family protein [Gluconacetobacter takamatsuzukensis]MBB2206165.1 site-2 protease family protein [Gluconacetobacter takamatsuzukensis]